jgi:hypothetical protein
VKEGKRRKTDDLMPSIEAFRPIHHRLRQTFSHVFSGDLRAAFFADDENWPVYFLSKLVLVNQPIL